MTMGIKYCLHIIPFTVFLLGCNNSESSGNQTHNTSNKKTSAKSERDIERTVTYQSQKLKFSTFYNAKGQTNKNTSFVYEIRGLGGGNVLQYNLNGQSELGRVDYLSTSLSNDVWLTTNSDTVRPSNIIFERNYGLAPFVRILMDFPIDLRSTQADASILIDEKVFGVGLLKFTYRKSFFDNISNV